MALDGHRLRRIAELLRLYGPWGLLRHARARLWRGGPQTWQVWQLAARASPGATPALPAAIVPLARLLPYADQLRPYKRGIDHLLRADNPRHPVALACFAADSLLGLTFLTRGPDGSWLSHDTFVVPAARAKR